MAFGQNSIVVDFAGSVKTIVQEFLAQGHQKIGMLSGQEYTKESTWHWLIHVLSL